MIEHLIKDIVPSEVARASRTVFNTAVKLTPVRTGSLRASWGMAIGADASPTPPVTNKDASAPISAPTPLSMSRLAKEPIVIIDNNTPYAAQVENGSPTNVARNMAATAVQSVSI